MIYKTIGDNPDTSVQFNPNKPQHISSFYRGGYYETDYFPARKDTGLDYVKLKTELDKLINDGASIGLIQNARVVRSKRAGTPGTITRINFLVDEAYNKHINELEPYKVVWDSDQSNIQSTTFNYSEDEIRLLVDPTPQQSLALLSANRLGAF